MNCKGKEQNAFLEIRHLVCDILQEMDGYHSEGIEKNWVMEMLRRTVDVIQEEEDKAKNKNAKFTCSHCESNKIYVCSPCMDDMANQYDNYPN